MIIIRKSKHFPVKGFDAVLKLDDGTEHEIPGAIRCYPMPTAIGEPLRYSLEIDGQHLKFEE